MTRKANQVGQINIALLNELIEEKKAEGRVVPLPIPEIPEPPPRRHKAKEEPAPRRPKAKDRRRQQQRADRARKRDQANDAMAAGLEPWLQQNRNRKSWSQ